MTTANQILANIWVLDIADEYPVSIGFLAYMETVFCRDDELRKRFFPGSQAYRVNKLAARYRWNTRESMCISCLQEMSWQLIEPRTKKCDRCRVGWMMRKNEQTPR